MLLDLGNSDLFVLVGYGFLRKIKNQITVRKKLFRGYKIRPTAIFYRFLFRNYGLSKVHYCMVVVGFGLFRLFHFGWP